MTGANGGLGHPATATADAEAARPATGEAPTPGARLPCRSLSPPARAGTATRLGPSPGAVGPMEREPVRPARRRPPDPGVAAVLDGPRRGVAHPRRRRACRCPPARRGRHRRARSARAAAPSCSSRRPAARPRTWPAALRCFLPGRRSADFPAWETLPHERLSPAQRHGRSPARVLRRLAHPDPEGADDGRPDQRRRGPGALAHAAAGQGPRRPRAGPAAPRRRAAARRGRRAPGGRRLRPHRPGRAARRVRRARRHPRRLPADRAAPAAGGVLGRHRRGGPLVQRSPTSAASRSPATACGRRPAASCCSPTTCAPAPASWCRLPGVADMLGKISEGIAVEGMESLDAGARRRDAVAARRCCPPTATSSSATPSRSAPGPTT